MLLDVLAILIGLAVIALVVHHKNKRHPHAERHFHENVPQELGSVVQDVEPPKPDPKPEPKKEAKKQYVDPMVAADEEVKVRLERVSRQMAEAADKISSFKFPAIPPIPPIPKIPPIPPIPRFDIFSSKTTIDPRSIQWNSSTRNSGQDQFKAHIAELAGVPEVTHVEHDHCTSSLYVRWIDKDGNKKQMRYPIDIYHHGRETTVVGTHPDSHHSLAQSVAAHIKG